MGELRNAGTYHIMETTSMNKDTLTPNDQVRYLWEEELFQFGIRSAIKKLVQRKLKENSRLRIIEFGSQQGQGFELITQIKKNHAALQLSPELVLPEELIELYLGLDPDGQFVEQANELTRHKKQARFIKADYSEGMGMFKDVEAPFDIYISREGALSHLTIYELRALIRDIIEHADHNSLIILDLKGKHAILHGFLMDSSEYTLWTGNELLRFFESLEEESGIQLELLKLMDRSILVASAQENRQYGHLFKHIRQGVNDLFTFNKRTDLHKLILKSEMFPNTAQPKVDAFFQELIFCWNLMIKYAIKRFETNIQPRDIKDWNNFPSAVQFGLLTLDRLIKDNEWIAYGDIRANLIEPHIAYTLRSLEFELQQGLGCGQNLNVVFQVKK